MKLGYMRVSSKDQLLVRQEVLMENLKVDKVFLEKVSGKNTNRPELQKMLNYIDIIRDINRDEEITVVVESISRFARNTRDLLELIELLQKKKVEFVSMKESIDTKTPTGKFMLTVFAAVAELEREYTLQRAREGIEAMPIDPKTGKKISLRNGRPTGRPTREFPKNWEKIYQDYKNKEYSVQELSRMCNIPRSSFYVLIKKWESQMKS